MSKNAKKIAVRQALSLKNEKKAIIVLDEPVKMLGKTKEAANLMKKLGVQDKNVLAVVSDKTPEILRATNNIPNLKVVRATYLNVFDILNADAVVFGPNAIKAAETWLIEKEEA